MKKIEKIQKYLDSEANKAFHEGKVGIVGWIVYLFVIFSIIMGILTK
jgi:hypothetical protein